MRNLLYVAIAAVFLPACSKKEEKVGEYVYVGTDNRAYIVHLDKNCSKNAFYWKVEKLTTERYCSRCVSEKQIKEIENRIAAHKEKEFVVEDGETEGYEEDE